MIHMMDEEEVFRGTRRQGPGAVVMLSSGYNAEQAARQFVDSGRSGFLPKRYGPAALVEYVASVRAAAE